jgi:O-antigen/teichoic acid export membrane protein
MSRAVLSPMIVAGNATNARFPIHFPANLDSDATIRRDIASAYLAAGARVVSWVVVSAFVYRRSGPGAFALLALVRGTLGLLNYATVGLAPAMIHFLPKRSRPSEQLAATLVDGADPPPIDYAPAEATALRESPDALYCNGVALAWTAAVIACGMLAGYEAWFKHRHGTMSGVAPSILPLFLTTMGMGTILRLASDPASALLQVRGKLAGDNVLLGGAELAWMGFTIAGGATLVAVGIGFLAAAAALLLSRSWWAFRLSGVLLPTKHPIHLAVVRALLGFGAIVTLAQVADFLYAPTDYILIDRLLRPIDIAAYAPAVQIDGGLLLLAMALASVVLPRAALAHAANDRAALRRYYLRGTFASAALLASAATLIWLISSVLLRIWLGNSMPATLAEETRAILPLVLVNSVIGGSSAVGRSILLGAGRVRALAIAALASGAANVVCSYSFVRMGGAGLRGIVLGTSVALIGRCLLWMPWYVLKTLLAREVRVIGEDHAKM